MYKSAEHATLTTLQPSLSHLAYIHARTAPPESSLMNGTAKSASTHIIVKCCSHISLLLPDMLWKETAWLVATGYHPISSRCRHSNECMWIKTLSKWWAVKIQWGGIYHRGCDKTQCLEIVCLLHNWNVGWGKILWRKSNCCAHTHTHTHHPGLGLIS